MYVIQYTDDLFEGGDGEDSGFAVKFREARIFSSLEEAKEHAHNLIDVKGIYEHSVMQESFACKWKREYPDRGIYYSGCGKPFCAGPSPKNTLSEHNWEYCPFCGNNLVEIKHQ